MHAFHNLLHHLQQKTFADRYPNYKPSDGKIHVLYFCPYLNGTGMYRAFMHCLELNKTTAHAAIINFATDWSIQTNGALQQPEIRPELIDWAHYIVFPTVASPIEPWLKKIKEYNPKVVCYMDMDDNIEKVPAIHKSKALYDFNAITALRANIAYHFDGVIYANTNLMEYYNPFGQAGGKITAAFVMPNLISIDLLEANQRLSLNPNQPVIPEMPKNKKFRIGMSLTAGHYLSAKEFRPILKELGLRKDIELINFGWDGKLGSYPNPFDKINIRCIPGVPFTEYFKTLASLQLDLALIPLNNNDFNFYKSPQKYFEYAMMGIPVIASDIEVYSDVIDNGENGYILPDIYEWIDVIDSLMDDALLREKIMLDAWADVWKHHSFTDEKRNMLTKIFK